MAVHGEIFADEYSKADMWKSQRSRQPIIKYISDHSVRLTSTQKRLIELTNNVEESEMLGSPDEMQLLANLCKAINAKKTIDVGVYTGYSALTIALALPADGKVYALDITEKYPNVGKPIWKEAGVYDKVDLRIAPALDTLQTLLDDGQAGTFDFAFIDADKVNYENYYEMCLKLIRSGGIIAIDNVLWSGAVLDPDDISPSTVAIKAFNTKLAADDRVDISMIFIGDGTTLAFKK